MENRKVLYQYGHNNKFNYYIIDTSDNIIEKELENNALSNIFGAIPSGKLKLFRKTKIPTGNFEIVLKITDKLDNFTGMTLANWDEIT